MGMEGLSCKIPQGQAGAFRQVRGLGLESGSVDVVSQEGMADMRQMDADLTGPTGLKPAGQQAGGRRAARPARGVRASIALQHLPVGDGLAAPLADRLAVAGPWMAVDRRVDRALGPVRRAPREGQIATGEGAGTAV